MKISDTSIESFSTVWIKFITATFMFFRRTFSIVSLLMVTATVYTTDISFFIS